MLDFPFNLICKGQCVCKLLLKNILTYFIYFLLFSSSSSATISHSAFFSSSSSFYSFFFFSSFFFSFSPLSAPRQPPLLALISSAVISVVSSSYSSFHYSLRPLPHLSSSSAFFHFIRIPPFLLLFFLIFTMRLPFLRIFCVYSFSNPS